MGCRWMVGRLFEMAGRSGRSSQEKWSPTQSVSQCTTTPHTHRALIRAKTRAHSLTQTVRRVWSVRAGCKAGRLTASSFFGEWKRLRHTLVEALTDLEWVQKVFLTNQKRYCGARPPNFAKRLDFVAGRVSYSGRFGRAPPPSTQSIGSAVAVCPACLLTASQLRATSTGPS